MHRKVAMSGGHGSAGDSTTMSASQIWVLPPRWRAVARALRRWCIGGDVLQMLLLFVSCGVGMLC